MGGEVAAILVLADLIDSISVDGDLCHSFIRTLVDILIEVLYSLYRTAELDVDMSVIPL
jgi:hypothetical protein